MKTHLDALKALDPHTRATLRARSDWAGLRHLGLYLLLIAACSGWIMLAGPLWWLALLPQGILLVFLFTLQHECTHETPFATPLLSRIAGHIIAVILFQPFNWFRYFHLAHHRYTNDPEKDPELLSGAKPDSWIEMIAYVSGWPTWRANITTTCQNAIAPLRAPYLPARALWRIKREARVMVAIYVCLALSLLWSSAVFWLWVCPALIAMPLLRIYLLAEHGRCPYVANMLENTRTTYTTRFVRFLAWNMPYHIEHHSEPNVPFHRLPALHQHLKADLITTSSGYVGFSKEYTAGFKTAR
ncbi:MAG: fatty acid desaturase [Planktotalea sp.]|uniref:fatty acid desaturase n=1 Tax=Planktotalea sp. TaxID=2029877 RepID=UPI003C7900BF